MPRRPRLVPEANRHTTTYAYVACRGPVRHKWDATAPPGERRRMPGFGTRVWFRCTECGTWRADVFSRITGDLLARWYDHPEGYRWDGEVKPTGAELRAMWAEQMWTEHRDLLEEGE